MEHFFLFFLSFLTILSAIMIIFNKNPVHSILFLVLVFVATTGLFLLLGVEFIAMLFLVVYIGAITVLFLFVIMMLNLKVVELNERFIKYLPMGLFIAFIFFMEIFFLINKQLHADNFNILSFDKESNYLIDYIMSYYFTTWNNYFEILNLTNIEQISLILYTKYVYIFLLAGIILLIAMIGAIVLTLNQKFKTKTQDFYIQTNRQINHSIRHLK